MPIYNFKCKTCGKKVENIMRIKDPYPLCCNEEMAKEVSINTSFILKGGGWYRDGYSRNSGASQT